MFLFGSWLVCYCKSKGPFKKGKEFNEVVDTKIDPKEKYQNDEVELEEESVFADEQDSDYAFQD